MVSFHGVYDRPDYANVSPIAAKVLSLMPPEIAAELTTRIAGLEEIPEHAVTEASESLVRALEAVGGLATSDLRAEFDGLAFSAAIVNQLPSQAGDDLLAKVSERDEKVATEIREAMFTFEDLGRIANRLDPPSTKPTTVWRP